MITKNCVIVLGAGSSKVFGFPSGSELKDEVLRLLANEDNYKSIFRKYNKSDITSFMDSLLESAWYSVDTFLEKHRQNNKFVEIGKIALAFRLIEHENENILFREEPPDPHKKTINKRIDGDWLQYLYNELMKSNFENFDKNNITFITYNYDRSVETFFFKALKNGFPNKSYEDVSKVMQNIKIIHLHGELGFLPWQNKGSDVSREYNTSWETTENGDKPLSIAAAGIKIIYQANQDSQEFIEARKILDEAESVLFLGFGYYEENINRLHLNIKLKKKFYGTWKGLTVTETQNINQKFFKGCLDYQGFQDYDCLMFLRNIDRSIFY